MMFNDGGLEVNIQFTAMPLQVVAIRLVMDYCQKIKPCGS